MMLIVIKMIVFDFYLLMFVLIFCFLFLLIAPQAVEYLII